MYIILILVKKPMCLRHPYKYVRLVRLEIADGIAPVRLFECKFLHLTTSTSVIELFCFVYYTKLSYICPSNRIQIRKAVRKKSGPAMQGAHKILKLGESRKEDGISPTKALDERFKARSSVNRDMSRVRFPPSPFPVKFLQHHTQPFFTLARHSVHFAATL